MKIDQELAELSAQIEQLETQAADLSVASYHLREKKEALIAQAIIEEKMLAKSTWDLQATGGASNTYLDFTGEYEGEIEKVRDLARRDYHSSFRLQEGVSLHFDDNDMSLHFDDPKMILPFAKRNDLLINGSNIVDRLSKLKREVVALETLVHHFNL